MGCRSSCRRRNTTRFARSTASLTRASRTSSSQEVKPLCTHGTWLQTRRLVTAPLVTVHAQSKDRQKDRFLEILSLRGAHAPRRSSSDALEFVCAGNQPSIGILLMKASYF